MDDLYCIEWLVLRWMICIMLNDLYYVEWFVLRWMIWTTLHDSHSVELFVQHWIICSTVLNYLYYVEWFVQRWMIFYFLVKFVPRRMICTALKDVYYVQWFGVWWMICTTFNHLGYDELLSIGFSTNPWVDFSWYQEEIFSALPQKLVIKRCFWSL